MTVFEKAQVGDHVVSKTFKETKGIIVEIDLYDDYPIKVQFEDFNCITSFDLDGRIEPESDDYSISYSDEMHEIENRDICNILHRFRHAQEHDEVYCRNLGDGYIKEILEFQNCMYPVVVSFSNQTAQTEEIYTISGKQYAESAEPILFYRKGEDRYLTERPTRDR